ncbi:MAG: hypothetical protein H7833_13180 [Magnetococcus sp. DMHC-1]
MKLVSFRAREEYPVLFRQAQIILPGEVGHPPVRAKIGPKPSLSFSVAEDFGQSDLAHLLP